MRSAVSGIVFLALATIGAQAATPRPGRTYLVSLTGLHLKADEYIEQFKLDTWGVEVISVCRIPAGWQITAGKSADPTGEISGKASLGVTFINRKKLASLRNLALVRLEGELDPVAVKLKNGERPATFAGFAAVDFYGSDNEYAPKRPLTYRNLRFKRARRCPPAPH